MDLEDKLMNSVIVKVISRMDFHMVMVNSFGMMELYKKADGKKAILKDQAENSKNVLLFIRIIIIFIPSKY